MSQLLLITIERCTPTHHLFTYLSFYPSTHSLYFVIHVHTHRHTLYSRVLVLPNYFPKFLVFQVYVVLSIKVFLIFGRSFLWFHALISLLFSTLSTIMLSALNVLAFSTYSSKLNFLTETFIQTTHPLIY